MKGMGPGVKQREEMATTEVCHSGNPEIGDGYFFLPTPSLVNQEAFLDCSLTLPSGPQWEEGHDLHGPRPK